ncbi:hypothetical protein [Lelliottia amnigena]|uniref:hypothetical protein n=1 Tax=Lelliottia amnigena TaxID=61646 RepID=UPI001C5C8E89|nr:hypothetical protein [Lelliottia amnigena]QXZ19063.1 hypothetical protein I6L75_18475 [Lelliottia amnigena]
MNSSDSPSRTPKAFGVNGLKNSIPVDSSPATDNNGIATFDKGFPPVTMQPLSAGGIPPAGQDTNGVLYAVSLKQQWSDAGMGYPYNVDFSTAISGYPKGSLLDSSNYSGTWLNTLEANTANPESPSGANTGWVPGTTYGTTVIAGLTSSSVILTSLQAAKERIVLSGALTSNINVILPAWVYSWSIVNNCTGNFSVICKTASGSGVIVRPGYSAKIYGDGVNIYKDLGNAAQRDVGTGSGQIPDMSNFGSGAKYFYLPNGFLVQTFQITLPASAATGTFNYPIPFTNACIGVTSAGASISGVNPGILTFDFSNKSSLRWWRFSANELTNATVTAIGI